MYQSQSNRSILSKSYSANKLYKSTDTQTDRQTDRQTYRQTDTFAKTIFSGSEGLWTFDKNWRRGGAGVHILQKSNTFSGENVKIYLYFLKTKLDFKNLKIQVPKINVQHPTHNNQLLLGIFRSLEFLVILCFLIQFSQVRVSVINFRNFIFTSKIYLFKCQNL